MIYQVSSKSESNTWDTSLTWPLDELVVPKVGLAGSVFSMRTQCVPAILSTSSESKCNIDQLLNWTPLTLNSILKHGSPRQLRIYADGVFDLFHIGHAKQFQQIKDMFPESYLIVGVVSDADTYKYKGGNTVISENERAEMVRHCRYVDEVWLDPPFYPTLEFVDKIKCDLVAHDDIPYNINDDIEDCYLPFKKCDRFLATARTPCVSTTSILQKILDSSDVYQKRQEARFLKDNRQFENQG